MKSSDRYPLYDAGRFLTLTYPVLEAQMIYTALELDLFTKLEEWSSCEVLSAAHNLHPRNTGLLLNALVACGYLSKQGELYRNLPETTYFLSHNSEMYLGDQILYWKKMTDLSGLTRLVREGPVSMDFSDPNGSDFFDFHAMGQGATNVMYTGRVQKFIRLVHELYRPEDTFSVFDLGCGSGIFSIEIAKNFTKANITLFDQPHVIPLVEKNLADHGAEKNCVLMTGNFVDDAFGGPYDFMIASGVMDFVGDLERMVEKLYDALSDRGFLYINTHGINDDFTGPKPYILGWLSSHLHGLDILKTHSEIYNAFIHEGFIEKAVSDSSSGIVFMKRACES
jgi:2-polyprenyl-3-methyl-5-hydroxy-6-metoxy-1,4-benzoquinol methylase